MDTTSLDRQITARSKEFFASISGEAPSIFNKGWWTGKVMDWSMKNENFKIQLFRFVDVLPYLNTSESLNRHIKEYFGAEDQDVPAVMKWGAKSAIFGGKITGAILNRTIRANLEGMAQQFIIGENIKDALKNIKKIRKNGFTLTVDILGEATVSEKEAEGFMEMYLELLGALEKSYRDWEPIGGTGLDWGHAPRVNISVKPSALFSLTDPMDFEGSVQGIQNRLIPILRKVKELQGFLRIDMEHHRFKDITLEVYKRLRASQEFRDYPHLGIALQSYLKETDEDLKGLLAWARAEKLPISVRLVKGAYWDYETVIAKQNGWEIPVYTIKAESDAAFERHTRMILENHDICHFACASHNVRTISAVMEMANELGVPDEHYEFQVLYGMAEPVRKGLLKVAKRVRLYAPYGDLLPGMAYLVRRLLENTANESFLRQSFAEEAEIDRLVENPVITMARLDRRKTGRSHNRRQGGPLRQRADGRLYQRRAYARRFVTAIAEVRRKLGATYPLFIGGQEVTTEDRLPSVNPANPQEMIGSVCQASIKEIDEALAAARKALPAWQALSFAERARFLFKAADIARRKQYELSAWQTLEVGKQWNQAQADVAEAIDFLEYYAREMIRLGSPRRMGNSPGEMNLLSYQGKGIAAVIAPWNFPLAISCGMSAAAIVAGNPVLYKPAGPSSVVGHNLVDIFREAGLPAGVFNYVPGRSSVMGDYLVEHPDVSLIAFTGSMEVGHADHQQGLGGPAGQKQIKKVIAEMGGKNAIIIDDDADLDEAIKQVINSAFAFQGQKCSACSRVIVVEPIYDKFKERLVEAASSLTIGPAEDPAFSMGPVVDDKARKSILDYVELAKKEGKVLVSREAPDTGYYVPLTIVEGIRPEHRIAQEEIFGPVLAMMKVKDFDQAIEWANSTRFALTGAIFSRSPEHLNRARRRIQRRQPLPQPRQHRSPGRAPPLRRLQHVRRRLQGRRAGLPPAVHRSQLTSENTMRRGFAPIEETDDWVD